MKDYKAAVIGCGRAGSLFDTEKKRKSISSHCGAYRALSNIELMAVCDEDKERLSTCAEFWEVKSTYLDYKQLLKDEKIDILSVCTLPQSHLEIVRYAASNGVKAIFCEKPISNSIKEAQAMIDVCENRGVFLTINHQRRWSSTFKDLKEKIDKKEFGEIQHINFLYTRGIYNSGSHLIDLLRMLFGEISEVKALKSLNDFESEETITASLKFLDGYSGLIIGMNGNFYRLFDLEIYFSKGKLTLDSSLNSFFSSSIESSRSSEFKELSSSKVLDLKLDEESLLIKALEEIISLLEGGKKSSCSGKDGYKSLELIKSLEHSFNKKEKISLPF